MPTNRQRIARDRSDQLNPNQESVLKSGSELLPGWPGFDDDEHRREAWAIHRERLMAEYARPGRRPHAFWRFDMRLAEVRDRWGDLSFAWPEGIETEEQMVYAMLERGQLRPLVRNGARDG
jgi:hypothetical protein